MGQQYELVGKTEESKTITEYSDIFEVDETFFKDVAVFTQRIKVLDADVNQFQVNLFYQICKEVCIPKDELFNISLDGTAFQQEAKDVSVGSLEKTSDLLLDLSGREKLIQTLDGESKEKSGLWMIFGLGFLATRYSLRLSSFYPFNLVLQPVW